MDYCHSCRRHLNGALACAGCGTPVEALAPAPEDELLVYAGAASGGTEVLAPSGHGRARGRGRGRSGGRGRRARRKRGKAILFGGAGLALVAGAVGFVRMAMEPPVHDRASAVREDQEISDPRPLPSGSAAGVPSAPTAKPGARERRSGAGAPARGVDVADAHTAGASPEPSRSAAPHPGPSSSSSAPVPSGSPVASGSPTPGGPSSPEQPPPPPPPSPSPSPTCRRILWWCA
ncbi:hypothetical protein [Streptomyces sp. NPDC007172]|uniref:SCO2400 family protein n=1 Tax=Streptomyces sp. NPDC007172 TaxID=3364776 RepID=UPI003674CD29